jgi:hypothetical protein
MEKATKRLVLRFVFWGIIIAAPVIFFSMGLVYLNAYLTAERVQFVAVPVFESISSRKVQIDDTKAHAGVTSWLDFRDIHFFLPSDEPDADSGLPDAHLDRMFVQFKPLSIFTRAFQIDSIIMDGFHGSITYDPGKSYTHFQWEGSDENRRLKINFEQSDLESIQIRSFVVKNSDFHYKHKDLNLEYYIDDFYQEVRIEGVRVMNMMLIYGEAGGVLKASGTGEIYTNISISGRLQINLDDRSFILRGGRLTIGEQSYAFTAFSNNEEDINRLSILFEDERHVLVTSFEKLPSSLVQWLEGELPGSRYRVTILYADEYTTDQT